MIQNFVIKKGKAPSGSLVAFLFFIIILYMQTQLLASIPIMFILTIAVLIDLIELIRWTVSFAVFLDMDKQEIILNHTLFFNKKKIALKDIKEIDTLNGNIILDNSFPLSKWQRMVCKTKKSNDYTVRFETIDACERRQLMESIEKNLL